jgi:hypothetical protein
MPIIATIGDANIIGNLVSQGNLIVLSQYSNLLGNLNVNQTANIYTLNVSTVSNLVGNVTINGNTFHLNNTYFTNANASGRSNLNTLGVIGQANLLSTLGVTGQTNLLSVVGVTGQANLFSTLGVTSAANLFSTLGVTDRTWLLSTLNVASNINTASNLSVQNWANLFTLNVLSNANLQQNVMVLGTSNLLGNVNVSASNTFITGTINIAGTSNINNALTVTGQTNLMSAANLFSTLNVVGQSNLVGMVGIQGAINAFSTLTVASGINALSTMNVISSLGVGTSANIQTLNVSSASNLNQSLTVIGGANLYSYLNAASLVVPGLSNLAQLGIYGNEVIEGNLIIKGSQNTTGQINSLSNISTPGNVIVGSNIVSGAGGANTGNVLMTGNLVVQGNIYFTSGALGTIGGLTLTNTSNILLSSPFSADANGNAFSFSLTPMQIKGTSAFIYVSTGGNIKFQLPGTYVLSGFFPGDATVVKVAIGSSSSDTHPTTKNYFYIQNFATTDRFNIPLVITDQTLFYYIDIYTNQAASNLAPTYATLGSNSGTFVSVTPHGTFTPQALNYPQTWTNVIGSSNIYNFGSVGIGTTNPQSNLAVVGAMSLGSYSLDGIAAPANSFIVSGQVGIGTASPTAKLFVTGNIVSTTNVTSVGFANVGSVLINGTQLIDASRNFTNVGTMSTGIITSTQVALAGYKNVVYRRPIWGVGSRIGGHRSTMPYGISEVAGTVIANVYSPFTMTTVATGATRRYRLFMAYTLYGATLGGSFKVRCYFSDASTIDFTMASSAVSSFVQDGYSNEQAVSSALDAYFAVVVNPSNFSASGPFNISIDYLEIQALDNY